ncbi:MAG: ABC transporter ATP-binding protein [Acidimicrobiia bacterium]
MTALLELRSVSKTFGFGPTQVSALNDVSVNVDRGEMVAVMGPSGSGKSTLLTIAGSLEDASSGSVLIDGEEVSSMSLDDRARLRRRNIGFVFQDFNLLPGLNALENVSLPLELDGIEPATAQPIAHSMLKDLGLGERALHFPDELSGGEQQRVAIARAAVGHRRLVLADEPTGALDSATGESVLRLLLEVCRSGMAVVLVTHDSQLAAWADRVVFLRDGKTIDNTIPPPGPESLLDDSGR